MEHLYPYILLKVWVLVAPGLFLKITIHFPLITTAGLGNKF